MSVIPPGWRPTRDELKQKTILITGASDGIGKAVALACASFGAEVLLSGRNEAALERVYDDIVNAGREPPALPEIGQLDVALLLDPEGQFAACLTHGWHGHRPPHMALFIGARHVL